MPVGHAALEHAELEQLAQRLDAERARLHRVLEEVRLEEPLARVDVLLGAQVAEPLAAALGPVAGDAVEHQQHRAGQPRRAVEVARGPRREVDRGAATAR